jgi:hypothetical protein
VNEIPQLHTLAYDLILLTLPQIQKNKDETLVCPSDGNLLQSSELSNKPS